ncbi:MAG: metallophosphoesterase [Candidatus Bathyarchaeota archaeon]
MRFAVLADTHIGRSIPLAIAEYRREAFNRAFSRAVDLCVERGVDYVFIGGDLFERRTLRPNLVQFAHDELYRLARENLEQHGVKVKILVVRGNHDGRPQSDTLDYIKHPLADYLHVFGDTQETVVYRDERLYVVGLNYYDHIQKAFDFLAVPGFKEAQVLKVLLVHHFIQGYNKVPPYSEYLTLDQLASVDLDFVFTGHHHEHCDQKKLSNGGWVLTPGSLEMYDFAENPDKGFYFVEIGEGEPRFEWVPLEPMHVMRQVKVEADRRRPPQWFMDRIREEVQGFAEELKKADKQGYLRVVVEGKLSEGFPSDVTTREAQAIMEQEPSLLWVDVETMRLDLPPMAARPESTSGDVAEYFNDFGEFSADIRDMHRRVKEALENEASEQTGLLTPTVRTPFVADWVERFEARRFKEEQP